MNKEEINEAIKLIKEPIIVNSVEYKYFSQENYEKLLSVYENCRWFIDNYEQVLQNIENLQQELKRKDNNWNELKEWLKEPQITYNLDASEFGIEKIECVSIKDTLNKIQELENGNK